MSTWLQREARRINKARALLQPAIRDNGRDLSSVWADFGCGDGIFTAVLHTMLRPGSEIYAVDKKQAALKSMQRNMAASYPEAFVKPILADFTQLRTFPAEDGLDGLIMANALHFVRRKKPVLAQLISWLKPGGRLIIVEYNTSRGTFAVPHPLDETGFLALATEAGLHDVRIITRVPSTYLGQMYTGMGVAY